MFTFALSLYSSVVSPNHDLFKQFLRMRSLLDERHTNHHQYSIGGRSCLGCGSLYLSSNLGNSPEPPLCSHADEAGRRLETLIIRLLNTSNQPLPVANVGFALHRLFRRPVFHVGYPGGRFTDPVTMKPGDVIDVRFAAKGVVKTFTEAGYSSKIRLRPYTLLVTRRRYDGKTHSLSLSEIASDDTSQA
jgi:hypothetical protein